jgi:hypothetical protein
MISFNRHSLRGATWRLAMTAPFSHETEPIDHKTSKSICDAIGERLQQFMRPVTSAPPDRLQHLLDELRRRDRSP